MPEHCILTTGTFNLVVKEPNRLTRLSGTSSVQSGFATRANPAVLETLLSYPFLNSPVNPLCSQDFHLFCTTLGSLHADRCGALFGATRNASSALKSYALSAQAEAEDHELRKDLLEVFANYAKPFEELCPRIKTPWPGSYFLGYLFRCRNRGGDST